MFLVLVQGFVGQLMGDAVLRQRDIPTCRATAVHASISTRVCANHHCHSTCAGSSTACSTDYICTECYTACVCVLLTGTPVHGLTRDTARVTQDVISNSYTLPQRGISRFLDPIRERERALERLHKKAT